MPLLNYEGHTDEALQNLTNYEWGYEYYYDYLDPIVVDERQLKYYKYSIVIIFWISLAAFVGLLFVVLSFWSRTGNASRAHRWQKMRSSALYSV